MIKFLVFSDLHYDEVPDGDKRIENILVNARKRDLQFIVSLGDLCKPVNANRKILERFHSLGVPFYNVIGNHETDDCKLNEILEFFSIGNPYYSVVCGKYKLIFLNTCYLRDHEKEETYYNKNYKNNTSIYPIMPVEEIQWLREELSHGMKHIIFSHHSFANNFAKRGVYNREEIRKMFEEKPVLLCMNGHDHGDSYSYVNGISYLTVNSANYAWLGSQIASSKELQKRYSYLH